MWRCVHKVPQRQPTADSQRTEQASDAATRVRCAKAGSVASFVSLWHCVHAIRPKIMTFVLYFPCDVASCSTRVTNYVQSTTFKATKLYFVWEYLNQHWILCNYTLLWHDVSCSWFAPWFYFSDSAAIIPTTIWNDLIRLYRGPASSRANRAIRWVLVSIFMSLRQKWAISSCPFIFIALFGGY